MPRFLVLLDVDSTLIENEVIELLAEEAGSLDEVAAITAQAMDGKLDFEASLRARVATLAGLPASSIESARQRVVVTPGAVEMIAAVHAASGVVAVVSGGFHEVIDPIASALGLDHWRANRLRVADGVLTGDLLGSVIDAEAKAATLREWAATAGIPLAHTLAVGDGANDLAMMAIAGLAVGFDSKAPVRQAADVLIDVRDLAQLLPLVGLRG